MAEIPQGKFAALRQVVSDKITADPQFQGIVVITEKIKDFENEIQKALAEVNGICLIVLTPIGTAGHPNIPKVFFDNVTVMVRVIENPTLNQGPSGTNLPASYIAEKVAACVHWLQMENRAIFCTGIKQVPDKVNLVYDVMFKTELSIR